METKEKTTRRLRPLLPLLPPVLLSLLFYLFRGRQALMDGWVIHVMTPAEQLLGRLSAPLPFSLAEALVTVFLTACALCLIRGTVLAVRLHAPHELGRRLVACSVPCFGYGPATAGFGLRATTPPPSQKRAVWRPGPTPCPPWPRSRCTLPARPQTSPPRWSETARATSLRIWTTVSAGESPSMRSWSRSSPV